MFKSFAVPRLSWVFISVSAAEPPNGRPHQDALMRRVTVTGANWKPCGAYAVFKTLTWLLIIASEG